MYVCMYVYIMYMYICMYECIYGCMYIHIYVCMYLRDTCTHVYMYMYVSIYVHVCIDQYLLSFTFYSDIAGRNVLHISSSFGHLDQVEWLLKRKGRTGVDSTDIESRWSSLHRAAYFGHVGILVCLMKHGGNLELLDNDNYTPLHLLISNLQNNLHSLPCKYLLGHNLVTIATEQYIGQ